MSDTAETACKVLETWACSDHYLNPVMAVGPLQSIPLHHRVRTGLKVTYERVVDEDSCSHYDLFVTPSQYWGALVWSFVGMLVQGVATGLSRPTYTFPPEAEGTLPSRFRSHTGNTSFARSV